MTNIGPLGLGAAWAQRDALVSQLSGLIGMPVACEAGILTVRYFGAPGSPGGAARLTFAAARRTLDIFENGQALDLIEHSPPGYAYWGKGTP